MSWGWALLGSVSLGSGTGVGAPEQVPPLLSGGPKQTWRSWWGGRWESLQTARVLGVTEAQLPNNSPPFQSGPVSWAPQRGEPGPRHQPGQPGPAMPAAGPELAAPHQHGQQKQHEDLKEEHRGGARVPRPSPGAESEPLALGAP